MSELVALSPRQRECLRLVWERRTSKEIAAELGISASTVDGYIKEAIGLLNARDRRDAAAIVFGVGGITPPDKKGAESSGVAAPDAAPIPPVVSTKRHFWPQPNRSRQPDTQSLVQVLGQIGMIAIGSMVALSLALSLGAGVPTLLRPALKAFDRLVQ